MARMEVIGKSDFIREVWERVKCKLDERHMSQSALRKKCVELGYAISQPELSRLYSGRASVTLYQLTAFAEVLGYPVDYFLNEKSEYHRFHLSGQAFASDPSDGAFEGYLGIYHAVFHSTSPFENKLLFGTMTFAPSVDGDLCEARFQLDTGEKDSTGKPVTKMYTGQLLISSKLSVAFCLLTNEQIGEISMIEFRHRNFLVKQAECRMGLVLTVTAGEQKRPVANRIFLARKPFTEELLDKISPFLKIGSDELLINRKDMEELLERDRDLEEILKYIQADEYFLVDESAIRKSKRKTNRMERAALYSLFREVSVSDYQITLGEEDDSVTYDLIRSNDS